MKFNLKTYLAKTSAIRLAIWLGILAEFFLCGAFVLFGRFGPCGPGNYFTAFVLMFHVPGIWLAERIAPDNGVLGFSLAIASGLVIFIILFWIVILLWRKFIMRNSVNIASNVSPES